MTLFETRCFQFWTLNGAGQVYLASTQTFHGLNLYFEFIFVQLTRTTFLVQGRSWRRCRFAWNGKRYRSFLCVELGCNICIVSRIYCSHHRNMESVKGKRGSFRISMRFDCPLQLFYKWISLFIPISPVLLFFALLLHLMRKRSIAMMQLFLIFQTLWNDSTVFFVHSNAFSPVWI